VRIGSLFSGAGGLDLAVEAVFGGETVWHCENDLAASKILAAHWPYVPNLGDITKVDWGNVEPVELVCAGWPCQPWSAAGRRKGTKDERALWPYVAAAVSVLRPRIVVLENVPGIVVLGELARAVGDLAALGYDAQWTVVSAADVGSCHKRERVFVVATDTGDRCDRHAQLNGGQIESQLATPLWYDTNRRRDITADTEGDGRERWPEPAQVVGGPDAGPVDLLPTPTVNDMGDGKTVEWWDDSVRATKRKATTGTGTAGRYLLKF
jgi:DNA-cytosine methyltransferase